MNVPSRQELKKIIASLKDVIAKEPTNAPAHHDLGVAYMHMQKWAKAKEHLNNALRLKPNETYVTANYHLGTVCAEEGNMDAAIEHWKKVLERDERNVLAHYSIAKAYANKGLLDAAIMHLRKADRYNTNEGLQLINKTLAQVYMMKGELDAAYQQWQEIYASNTDDPEALHNLASVCLYMNKLDEAIEYTKKEIELGQTSQPVYYNLGLAHMRKAEFDEAIENLEKALAVGPEDQGIRVNLGEAYARRGLLDKAFTTWENVLEKDPKNVHASYNIGVTYFDNGFIEKAIDEWNRTINIDPEYLPVYVTRGTAYVSKEDFQSALDDWLRAKELAPKNVAIQGNLAELYLFMKQPEKAMQQCDELLEIDQERPMAYIFKGLAHALKEEWQKAVTLWQKAQELEKNVFYWSRETFATVLGLEGLQQIAASVEGPLKDTSLEIAAVLQAEPQEIEKRLQEQVEDDKEADTKDGLLAALLRFLRR